jgi:MEDS: MEthanogen/methylotroph, DcmR Sensory domain
MFRNSLLFQFKHGDHTCVFYRNEDSLREVLTPYIADGLRRGERCFCAQAPQICKRLVFDLQFLGIDTDSAIRRGALEIHSFDEVYFPNGKFVPDAMMDLLLRSVEDASHKGFTALRTAGELSWASQSRAVCDQILTYEKLVDEVFPGKPVIGLCQYNLGSQTPEILERLIHAHRAHLYEGRPSASQAGLSIRTTNCWTEIVADKLIVNPNYYYVVQRRRPAEILGWGIASSFDAAHERAERIAQSVEH